VSEAYKPLPENIELNEGSVSEENKDGLKDYFIQQANSAKKEAESLSTVIENHKNEGTLDYMAPEIQRAYDFNRNEQEKFQSIVQGIETQDPVSIQEAKNHFKEKEADLEKSATEMPSDSFEEDVTKTVTSEEKSPTFIPGEPIHRRELKLIGAYNPEHLTNVDVEKSADLSSYIHCGALVPGDAICMGRGIEIPEAGKVCINRQFQKRHSP